MTELGWVAAVAEFAMQRSEASAQKVLATGGCESVVGTDTGTVPVHRPAFPCDHEIGVRIGRPVSGRCQMEALYFALRKSPRMKSQNRLE